MGMTSIIGLLIVGFVLFMIYFILKSLQFVLQAVNLYKQMINRQDTMIKLLVDIKKQGVGLDGTFSTENDEDPHPGYVLLQDENGDAYCAGCKKVVSKKGMLFNFSHDIYYHPECIPKQ
jgi:hypothetical protein